LIKAKERILEKKVVVLINRHLLGFIETHVTTELENKQAWVSCRKIDPPNKPTSSTSKGEFKSRFLHEI
jgi:hypothetical protein